MPTDRLILFICPQVQAKAIEVLKKRFMKKYLEEMEDITINGCSNSLVDETQVITVIAS